MKYQYNLQIPNFTVDKIDIFDVSRQKGFKNPFPHGRGKHGFIYTVSGRICDVFAQGKEKKIYVGKGELIFIPKHCVYTGIYAEENTEIKIVQFDITSGQLPDYLKEPVKLDIPRAGELMDAFFEPIENNITNHPFYNMFCFYRLLWQVDECYSRIPAKYKKLQSALSEMNVNFQKNYPVSFYAGLCDMSEVSFRRLLREYTGLSPIEYRNDIRLEAARNKLQSGEYNVSETATLCGFTNLSFFIRLYKKKFGHTPKHE